MYLKQFITLDVYSYLVVAEMPSHVVNIDVTCIFGKMWNFTDLIDYGWFIMGKKTRELLVREMIYATIKFATRKFSSGLS